MSLRDLSSAEEQALAAVVALASYRTFDGNEPAGIHALTGQLIGLQADADSLTWHLRLDPGATPPVGLPDGPITGRYFVGEGTDREIVVSVSGGRLSSLELVHHDGTEPAAWPTAGEVRPG